MELLEEVELQLSSILLKNEKFQFGSRDFVHCGHWEWCLVDFLLKRTEVFNSYTEIPFIQLRLLCWPGLYFSLTLCPESSRSEASWTSNREENYSNYKISISFENLNLLISLFSHRGNLGRNMFCLGRFIFPFLVSFPS